MDSSIANRIEDDIKAATKQRAPELECLRLIKSTLGNEAISLRAKNQVLGEAEVIAVLRREFKRRHEAATIYKSANRPELASKELFEAEIIKKYLPAEPAAADIKQVAERLKNEMGLSGMSAMGPLTKAIMQHFGGAVSGQTVSSIVKEILSV